MDGRLIYLMGPSGSGKDSLIEAAREPLQALNCEVVRRVITRSAESVGEDAIGVSREEFEQHRVEGDFALYWSANGLDYGIPVEIDQWLGQRFSRPSGSGAASVSNAVADSVDGQG